MRISVLGGTGKFGKGLVIRWLIRGHEVYIGSRVFGKARRAANDVKKVLDLRGFKDLSPIPLENKDAASKAEVVVMSIPYEGIDPILESIAEVVMEKIVVSPIVPMRFERGKPVLIDTELSVAEYIASKLNSRVVSALHTVPSSVLIDPARTVEGDVIVCGDDNYSKRLVSSLIEEIPNLRALNGGPLRNSRIVEKLTYLIIEIGLRMNRHNLVLKLL